MNTYTNAQIRAFSDDLVAKWNATTKKNPASTMYPFSPVKNALAAVKSSIDGWIVAYHLKGTSVSRKAEIQGYADFLEAVQVRLLERSEKEPSVLWAAKVAASVKFRPILKALGTGLKAYCKTMDEVFTAMDAPQNHALAEWHAKHGGKQERAHKAAAKFHRGLAFDLLRA